ncbi:uncharacterized protein LOC120355484 [Nilaparvata lugens]|uniref:uncharacterized protein LOC120355484 n=1 Tax=Nilaparvata lugens TaxID=108931 RepID=UPI00193E7B2C|nr:uncharacterized protein LOC120355484 [Nilaparvata lugens]
MFGKQAEAPPPTMAEEMILYKRHLATIRKRYFGALCKEMENAETITPDIAAAMVYSGELGLSMKAAPEKVYDFLYPEAPGNETITIADVMTNLPKGLDDIVVPIVPPITIESRNYPDMEDPAMLDSPRVIQIGPALNLIDEPEVKGLLDPIDIKELVTGHTSANYLELMFPEVADMQLEEEEESEEKALEKAREEMFNIELVGSLPQHFSQVQMRGTIPPSWFPGYWTASPSREGVFKSSRPSEVMEYIWEEMQPERVRPAGAAYIIGN